VGVSNFTLEQLVELEKHGLAFVFLALRALNPCWQHVGLVPAVNQIEMHPMLVQRELRDYCRAKGIAVMAYNSLGKEGGNCVVEPWTKTVTLCLFSVLFVHFGTTYCNRVGLKRMLFSSL
jgi:diketogulonate reductase-like aldo/keto reductase